METLSNICTILAYIIVTQTGNVDAVRFYTIHVHEHENLAIQCNTYGHGGLSDFFWFKHGLDGGSSVHYGTGRSLNFVDIRKNATAVYVCHAFNSYISEYVMVSGVKVYVESRVDASHIETKYILEYENLRIQCNTSGLEDLGNFFWIKNGTDGNSSVYYGSGRSLDFVDIHIKASGVYICNTLSKTRESFAVSAIKVEVKFRVDAANVETTHVLEHENVKLQCNTTGLANLTDFFWTKNGTDGDRSDFYGKGRSLDFVNIHKEASGVYVCHARYALKNKTREILTVSAVKIDVQLRVDVAHIETKHVMEHENLEIKCNTSGLAGLRDFFWIQNGTGGNSSVYYGSGPSLDFVDIHVTATGVYICHALNNNTRERLTVSAIKLVVHLRIDAAHVKTKHVLEHGNLTLHCNTSRLADIRDLVWIKDGNGDSSGVYSGSGRSLAFVDIHKEATGVYVCHAKNAPNSNTREGLAVSAVKVDVQYPAEVRSFSLEPRSIVSSQSPAFSCAFYGNPEPTWSIFNRDNDHVILSMNHSHEVHMSSFPLGCGDTGMWVCSGFNALTHGVNASRGYELTVLCPPVPDPDVKPTYTYKAAVGDTVTMRLDIQADPAPAYFWSRDDGQELGANVNIQNGPRSTALCIYGVYDSDFGDYTLKMDNSFGSYEAHFTLQKRANSRPDEDSYIGYIFGGAALILVVCGGAYFLRKCYKKWCD